MNFFNALQFFECEHERETEFHIKSQLMFQLNMKIVLMVFLGDINWRKKSWEMIKIV